MIKRLFLSLAMSLSLATGAFADVPNAQYTPVLAIGTNTFSARVFFGVGSTATQLNVVGCFDGVNTSGTQLYSGTPTLSTTLGIPALPTSGIVLKTGFFTCTMSVAIIAPGYLVYWSQ